MTTGNPYLVGDPMISLEAARAAVLSENPWQQFDELVRAEMAAGRKVKEIAAAFSAMFDDVWDTPGVSEDGKDAFGDTYDALTGNCHRDCCYYDPPNTSLPSEDEIVGLPRWARVAFAARCARRVEWLFYSSWQTAPGEHRQDVANAVEFAEQSARTAKYVGGHRAWAHEAAERAPTAAAAHSAWAANSALGLAYDADQSASGAVSHAFQAATEITNVQPDIRRDFDRLAHLAQWQRWTDDTPVPPDVFGPLWPEGPPLGWPTNRAVAPRIELQVTLVSRDGLVERIPEDEAAQLFDALNAYSIARTGTRLTLEDLHTLLASLVPAEV